MIFNLVSNLDESFDVAQFYAYNHVIAYSLRKELQKQRHMVNLVRDHSDDTPPKCDHTIIISNIAMTKIQANPAYFELHRKATSDKLCLWFDSDMGNWSMFDRVFCVNRRTNRHPELYKYVGWATDPEIFYPAQQEKTAFVDSFMWGWYDGRHDHVYESIRRVLEKTEIRTIQLVPEYNKVRRAYWTEMIEAFRKSHFHICTQRGGWGWTNIEAATCGALLVCHRDLHLPNTFPSLLNLAVWSSEEELRQILSGEVDVQANRKVALENNWEKIISRMMDGLN